MAESTGINTCRSGRRGEESWKLKGRTYEVGDEEEDVLRVRLCGREINGYFGIDDVDCTASTHLAQGRDRRGCSRRVCVHCAVGLPAHGWWKAEAKVLMGCKASSDLL